MEDYKQYLAQKILTEDQVVTYRLLSRALKVHVNTAKEMLYEFHKRQNEKKPNTLHATYILYGSKSPPVQEDEDVEMTNSQMSEAADLHVPYSDLVPTYTLSLVRQEQLQETLSQYDEVTSLHIYSLAPHPLKDLQILIDVTRQVRDVSMAENIPNPSKVYGSVANPNVRKRERRGGPVPVASKPQPKVEPKVPVKQEAKPAPPTVVKEEPKEVSRPATTSTAAAKKSTPASSLKRQGSSGIGQMFAKAAAKPKKPAPKAATEDNQATGALSDDGEDDAEPMSGVKTEDNTTNSATQQARKDRQAQLRRMMEESDEEEAEPDKTAEEEDPMDEEPPPPEPEPEAESKKEEEGPAEVVSSTGGGRRRGRRRVMRKKQILDEKGYLVTMQEPGWESFSEDEAPAPPPKPKPQQKETVKSEPSTTKSKKGAAGKGAQGNIMSFFSKK
ncbi:DNA polymerase subunit Cdc27 [Xylaria arbuscula]|nr:DNA polymerase subunit Cdc27 [Xylaria arbuscula]